MRLTFTSIAVCAALLLTGCTSEGATQPITPTPASPPASLSEQERLDQQIRTAVNLYGEQVCRKLAEMPKAKISDLVDSFVINYAPKGTTAQDGLTTAHRLLTDAAAKYCPEQSARVAKGLADGK
jgi:hypothetical protein